MSGPILLVTPGSLTEPLVRVGGIPAINFSNSHRALATWQEATDPTKPYCGIMAQIWTPGSHGREEALLGPHDRIASYGWVGRSPGDPESPMIGVNAGLGLWGFHTHAMHRFSVALASDIYNDVGDPGPGSMQGGVNVVLQVGTGPDALSPGHASVAIELAPHAPSRWYTGIHFNPDSIVAGEHGRGLHFDRSQPSHQIVIVPSDDEDGPVLEVFNAAKTEPMFRIMKSGRIEGAGSGMAFGSLDASVYIEGHGDVVRYGAQLLTTSLRLNFTADVVNGTPNRPLDRPHDRLIPVDAAGEQGYIKWWRA